MTAGWQEGPPDYRPGVTALPYTGEHPIRDRSANVVGIAVGALSGAIVTAAAMTAAMWAGWIG